jgi:hypothetical protein
MVVTGMVVTHREVFRTRRVRMSPPDKEGNVDMTIQR